MRPFLRRLRGLVGSGLMWAGGFIFGMGAFLGTVTSFSVFWETLPILGSIGFLMGFSFGGILAVAERRRKLEDISLLRVGLWGAAGSFLAVAASSLVMGSFPGLGLWSAITGLSAVFASGQVALAKRSVTPQLDRDDPFLLEESK